MNHLIRRVWLLLPVLAAVGVVGCNPAPAAPGAPPPPEVKVSLPISREVTDYENFPGRTESINTVEVRSRVTGYLDKVSFKEGAEVKEGDVLFEIDPRPTQAELNRAAATFVQAQAHLDRLNADYQRAQTLLPKGGISREEYDKIVGDRAEASAAVGVAKANKELAELNLGYTKVKAPFSGRISRRFVDPGNLVKADDTILTTLVTLDRMYAYFDLDERTALRMQGLVRAGKVPWSEETGLPVWLGLADEQGFPHKGTINFADNRVDADTGTWRLRAVFDNKDGVLAAGLYVRMHLPIGDAYRATLVAEQALATDQGRKFVYVVDDAGLAQYRAVKVGRQHGKLRVIEDGLTPTDKVVVSGLQRVRPGAPVAPTMVDMPGQETVVAGKDSKGVEK